MSLPRAFGLTALTAALVAYCAVAGHLWNLPTNADVAFESIVVFPAFAAAIWLALPIARESSGRILAAALVTGVLALGFGLVGVDPVSNVAKLACYALVGFTFLTLFEELWWVAAVSLAIPWVDIWSVAAGPTRYVVRQRPGLFDHVSVAFPVPGEHASVNLGPPDVVFFSLFLAAADRFGLRVGWTWLAMTGCLSLTLALVWKLDLFGLPALPAISLGFLAPNADLLWRSVHEARARARMPSDESS